MPADLTALSAKVDEIVAQVTATEGTEASAIALINGFAAAVTKAVTDAITADDAIDNAAIAPLVAVIEDARKRFADSGAALGAAVVANQPPA